MIHSGHSGYRVAGPTRRCNATGRALEPGERFVATLIEAEDGLERRDYCPQAWEHDARDRAKPLAVWRAVVPEKDAPAGPIVDPAEVLELFESLDGCEDPTRTALRYVLALMLVRRRVLEYEGTRGGVLEVRTKGAIEDATRYRVPDPNLDDARIAEVGAQLESVLGVSGDQR